MSSFIAIAVPAAFRPSAPNPKLPQRQADDAHGRDHREDDHREPEEDGLPVAVDAVPAGADMDVAGADRPQPIGKHQRRHRAEGHHPPRLIAPAPHRPGIASNAPASQPQGRRARTSPAAPFGDRQKSHAKARRHEAAGAARQLVQAPDSSRLRLPLSSRLRVK